MTAALEPSLHCDTELPPALPPPEIQHGHPRHLLVADEWDDRIWDGLPGFSFLMVYVGCFSVWLVLKDYRQIQAKGQKQV